jgi:virulence factor Mce-like protein
MRMIKGNPQLAAGILVTFVLVVIIGAVGINLSSGLPFNLSLGWPPSSDYTLSATFSDANGVSKGANVLIAGAQVGQVSGVTIDHDKALVTMRIERKYGPLHRGTIAAIRYSTLLAQKYVELTPASGTATLASGSTIPSSDTVTPVDFDQFLSGLDARTRQQLQVLVQQVGGGVAGREAAINALVDHLSGLSVQSPPTLDTLRQRDPQLASIITNLNSVATTLAASRDQLGGLVHNTSMVTQTLASNDRSLDSLLTHLATVSQDTAQTLQGNAGNLRNTITTLNPVLVRLNPQLDTTTRYLDQGLPTLNAEARYLIPEVVSAIAQQDAGGNYLREYVVINTCYDTLSNKPVNPHKNCLAQITGPSSGKSGSASGQKKGQGKCPPATPGATPSPSESATPKPSATSCPSSGATPSPSPTSGLGGLLGLLGGGN